MVRAWVQPGHGPSASAAGIFGLLLGIFLLRAFVDTPGLSLVFLAVFPIVLAAFVLGRTAAVVCAALATVLSVVVPDHQSGHRRQHGRADRRGGRARSGLRRAGARRLGHARAPDAAAPRAGGLRARAQRARGPARRADGARAARARRPHGRHLLHAGRGAGGGRLLPRRPRRGEQHAGRRRRRRRPRPRRRAPRVVRARDDRALRRVRRRPDDDPAPGQHGAGRARPGHRVRDRAVRELRPRSRHRDVGERRPSAAVGPRPRRAAGQRAPLPAAGDRADARGDLGDDRAAARRGRPALHRRAARGAHRARGAAPRAVRRAGGARRAAQAARLPRRPTSWRGCARPR